MNYEGYLIDLDGTMYRGNEAIRGAKEFIEQLNEQKIPYLFVTNNSTLTRQDVVKKLFNFGVHTTEDHVLTSATATANYIKRRHSEARCFVIGEKGLRQALEDVEIKLCNDHCDFVVIGLDREISYHKLAKASLEIRKGASFISTNKDAAIPTEHGLLPGNGAITAAITKSTGVDPVFIGKPEKVIMEEALQLIGLNKDQVLMIGDNYETDILAGINAEIDTLMVLTGFSTQKDLVGVQKQPTYIKSDLLEWMHIQKTQV